MDENDLHIIQDIQKRLQEGADNPNLKTASLLLSKEEVMLLYGLCRATIDYYEMTKQTYDTGNNNKELPIAQGQPSRPLRRTKRPTGNK